MLSSQKVSDNNIGRDLNVLQNPTININHPLQVPQILPDINTLPSVTNSFFRGRKDVFLKMEEKFKNNSNKLVILYGPGGIGKTSIAYKFAETLPFIKVKESEKTLQLKVRIRIRADSSKALKQDFKQLALKLSIDAANMQFDEIVESVNQNLAARYGDSGGIIVFDNVPSFTEKYNEVRSKSVGNTISNYFIKHPKFFIIITTRNSQDWPKDSSIPVPSLKGRDSLGLFYDIARLPQEFDQHELSDFLQNTLGDFPLAICQVASYFSKNKRLTLKEYISLFAQRNKLIAALQKDNLSSEMVFLGETPKVRRAILTTYDLNIQSIHEAGVHFLRMLQSAALMNPDAIEESDFYGYSSVNCNFDRNLMAQDFESKVGESSLMVFHEHRSVTNSQRSDNLAIREITMHRIVQRVLLLKINDNIEIRKMILSLFGYYSSHYRENRICNSNFDYILRKIISKDIFFNLVSGSESIVIDGLCKAVSQCLENNEVDDAILFLGNAIENIDPSANQEQFIRLEDQLERIINNFNLLGIDEDWLFKLLKKVSSSCRRKIISIMLEKEKKLTNDRGFKDYSYYHNSIIALANAIINIYKSYSNLMEEENEQLAKSHYILGRAYCEKCTYDINGKRKLIEKKETIIENISAKISHRDNRLNNNPSWMTIVNGAIKAEIENLNCDIRQLRVEIENINQELKVSWSFWKMSYESLKIGISIRKKIDLNTTMPLMFNIVQLTRLHSLREFNGFSVYAKIFVDNYHLLKVHYPNTYESDYSYCQKIVSKKRDDTSRRNDNELEGAAVEATSELTPNKRARSSQVYSGASSSTLFNLEAKAKASSAISLSSKKS